MTKLELVQRLCQYCGISETGPSTTIGQTGEYLRAVNWVDDAYEWVQLLEKTWQFLRKEFSFPLVIGTASYTPTAAGLTDFSEWVADAEGDSEDFRGYISASDEQYLSYSDWDEFRECYMVGTQRTQTGTRPQAYTIKPDDTLLFYPIPSGPFTVLGEYYRKPFVMTTDDGVNGTPAFPERFHKIILFKAMMYYGAYSAEPDKYAHGERELRGMIRGLRQSQLPQMTWGNPLV